MTPTQADTAWSRFCPGSSSLVWVVRGWTRRWGFRALHPFLSWLATGRIPKAGSLSIGASNVVGGMAGAIVLSQSVWADRRFRITGVPVVPFVQITSLLTRTSMGHPLSTGIGFKSLLLGGWSLSGYHGGGLGPRSCWQNLQITRSYLCYCWGSGKMRKSAAVDIKHIYTYIYIYMYNIDIHTNKYISLYIYIHAYIYRALIYR